MLGILAPEAELLATVNAHLLKKILPSKEVKIVGKNLKLYQDLGTQISFTWETECSIEKPKGNKFML